MYLCYYKQLFVCLISKHAVLNYPLLLLFILQADFLDSLLKPMNNINIKMQQNYTVSKPFLNKIERCISEQQRSAIASDNGNNFSERYLLTAFFQKQPSFFYKVTIIRNRHSAWTAVLRETNKLVFHHSLFTTSQLHVSQFM